MKPHAIDGSIRTLRRAWPHAVLLTLAIPLAAPAQDVQLGLSIGDGGAFHSGNFVSAQVTASRAFGSALALESGWELQTRGTISLGMLRGEGETGTVAALGPDVVLREAGADRGWFLQAGFHPTLISETEFGTRRLGTSLQFTTYAGAGFRLGPEHSLLLHVQHMSNADLDRDNDGVNQFVLSYRHHL